MSSPTKIPGPPARQTEPEILSDEIAAIGAYLLLQNLESAGPYGRIGYVSLQGLHPAPVELEEEE